LVPPLIESVRENTAVVHPAAAGGIGGCEAKDL
jgi:hypothetical protein